MNITLALLLILILFLIAYFSVYWVFKRRISKHIQKMIAVMKADELRVNKPEDVFESSDDFFSDLERAAFSLRRKYLRLKKNSNDERNAYESVFSGLTEGLVTVDQNLKILSFNSRFVQIFKIDQQLIRKTNDAHPLFLHEVVRRPEVIEAFKKIFIINKSFQTQSEDLEIFINPLPSREENQKWAMGVFYDLSQMKKIDRMRIDFVANASHELRTPLTVIKGYSELLLQKIKSESTDLKALVEPIVQNSHSMTLLLEDLLNLSKLETSSGQIQKSVLNVMELTQDIMNEFDSVLTLNQKRIVCRFDAKTIWAEESGLKQIIRNLLNNAIRYSGDQAPEIHMIWEENSKKTFFRIKDFGPGILPEHQDRIFERFYRVDKGRSRELGGSGLGLALVKHQILNHGGNIQLKSTATEGTEFICEFNRKPESGF